MWSDIIREFSDSPSQSRVVKFLLENGFGVNRQGRIVCNGIEIPATQVAKAIGTDRRVVDTTARHILGLPLHRDIFMNMRATPDLSQVADSMGLSVMTIIPKNAMEKGIVGSAVRVIVENDLNIRQIFVTDPHLSAEPKLVIITDEGFPPEVIEGIRKLQQVKRVIL
ncbi:MAG TPA: regulator of amino acid metabolism, contains ACT domain protein [Methanoregulaceae archaeon]|nr:regulator of amino acid metabolism, contains ACT domain protein [Methanoregulaceae archaeon]